ncbi:hypothetical protein EXN66_Car017475 [Channa argus]|uniref:Uncharacterized protein n=1 Tax=Channa argus TaxID=215402 RepID=A0A6G1QH43_CHAAH|nr:hypothetical protein EXN66_Car017475 [Channa argus]
MCIFSLCTQTTKLWEFEHLKSSGNVFKNYKYEDIRRLNVYIMTCRQEVCDFPVMEQQRSVE